MKTRKLLQVVFSVALLPTTLFGANAVDVLRKAEVSDKYVSYRGIKVAIVGFAGGQAISTLKVIHLKPDKTRTEYFAPAALEGIILIQDGSESWKYLPKEHEWESVHCRGFQSCESIRQDVLRNYDVRLSGTDRVAGRPTYIVHAVPRREGESARRLWVDREYYLILGTQVENPSGAVLNSSRYTSVGINPPDISPAVFRVSGKVRTAQKPPPHVEFRIAKPSFLPTGYRLVGVSCATVNDASCAHMQFSNGANTISLFQHRAGCQVSPAAVQSKVTHVLTWARRGMQFTLIGDVPHAALRKIADSVP
jgi:outer membrane lipoprotein-sorting protein